jgi:hypothetical protein
MKPRSLEFTCAACGGFATRVTLVDADHPAPPDAPWHPLQEPYVAVEMPGSVFTSVLAPDTAASALELAIRAGNARALWTIDVELVPWWCPTCGETYCPDHWSHWVELDEGFFDEARGRCPRGHERMLWD